MAHSSNPIHPELRAISRVLPRGSSERSLRVTRKVGDAAERLRSSLSRHSSVDVVELVDCSVRVHRPPTWRDGPHPALVWIHGGGYVMGNAAQEDVVCRMVARELGAVVVSVDYRRAPEHPYPAPLEDCHDALVWTAARDDVDANRIAIGGASAGGGLAAALALLARDRGAVRPVLQVLSYPMLDDRTVARTDLDESGFRLWNNAANRYGWTSYLGTAAGSDLVDAPAVPARRSDLAGLPAAWIGVGTLDLFHDEDVAYAGASRCGGRALPARGGGRCVPRLRLPGATRAGRGGLPASGISARWPRRSVGRDRGRLSPSRPAVV